MLDTVHLLHVSLALVLCVLYAGAQIVTATATATGLGQHCASLGNTSTGSGEFWMSDDGTLLIGKGDVPVSLRLKYANRHGLIAGATGTGKTVTLQILTEGFSRAGVPVFLADVKGDLSGLATAGETKSFIDKRAETIGIAPMSYRGLPVVFWDLFGAQGHAIRATVSEVGPLLLSRMLELNDTQEGAINVAFALADDEGLALLDLKDLRSLLTYISENSSEVSARYGNVAKQTLGAIQRRLLVLEQQGGEGFFGEPALDLADIMRTAMDGRGIVNVLAADKLMLSPRLYATFLLWLLSELFEELPEVGDPDKPKLVFFFDEAHLLFDDAPKSLVQKVEQVVRLIRSKGVGVYFVTQNPIDVPEAVLGQLGNRVQHALRAFTPRDQKAVRAAAQTFRANPKFDVEEAITQVGVGEALVSVLESKGVPSVVERTLIRPPESRMGPLTPDERAEIAARSPVASKYDQEIDRESAHELLTARAEKAAEEAKVAEERETQLKEEQRVSRKSKKSSSRQGVGEAFAKSIVRAVGSRVGREIVRGILGSLFKGR